MILLFEDPGPNCFGTSRGSLDKNWFLYGNSSFNFPAQLFATEFKTYAPIIGSALQSPILCCNPSKLLRVPVLLRKQLLYSLRLIASCPMLVNCIILIKMQHLRPSRNNKEIAVLLPNVLDTMPEPIFCQCIAAIEVIKTPRSILHNRTKCINQIRLQVMTLSNGGSSHRPFGLFTNMT